jgi:hypothetical protein
VRRRDIIKRIGAEAKRQNIAWAVLREGANHTVYLLGPTRIPIPRHTEFGPGLTEQIFKETEPQLGERWWR